MSTNPVPAGEGKSDLQSGKMGHRSDGVKVVLAGGDVVHADGANNTDSDVVKAVLSAIERSGIKVDLSDVGKAGDRSDVGKAGDRSDVGKDSDRSDAKGKAGDRSDAKGKLPTGVKARHEKSPAEAEALLAASDGLRAILSDGDTKAKSARDGYPTKVAIYIQNDSKPDLFVYYDKAEFEKLKGVDVNDPIALEEAAADFAAASRGLSLDSDKLTGAMRSLELYNQGFNERRAQAFQGAFQQEVYFLESDVRVEIREMEKSLRRDLAEGERIAAMEIFFAKRCAALAEEDPEQAAAYAAAVWAAIEAQQSLPAYTFMLRSDNLQPLEERKFGTAKHYPNKVMHCSRGPVGRLARQVIHSPQAKRLAEEAKVLLKGEGKEATAEEILKVLQNHPRFVEEIIVAEALEDARAVERAAKRQLWEDLEKDFYRLIKLGGTLLAGIAVVKEWKMNTDETPEHLESFFE